MIGHRIGSYRITRRLGRGGMAQVFEAQHERIYCRVAIKILQSPLGRDPQIAARLFNEARAVNLVRHPGIVGVSEHGQLADGRPYLAMEFLEGEPLRARLERRDEEGGLVSLRLMLQISEALAAAHDKGIIHRDLKPENIMVVSDPAVPGGERAKVLDFGLAKIALQVLDPDLTPLAGSGLWDVGSLFRYPGRYSPEFCARFACGYQRTGADLPDDWHRAARVLDGTRSIATFAEEFELPAVFADCREVLAGLVAELGGGTSGP